MMKKGNLVGLRPLPNLDLQYSIIVAIRKRQKSGVPLNTTMQKVPKSTEQTVGRRVACVTKVITILGKC